MVKTLRAIILMLGQLLCATGVEAQLYFSTTDRAQGLPDNYVNTIAEDSQGYIWIGTLGGISRFDGYQHHVYTLSSPDGRTINNVTDITVDDNGQLWATDVVGEIFLYDPKHDSFEYQHKWPAKHKPATEETDSLTDAKGRHWVTTNNSGLRMGDQWFTKDNADPYSLPSNHLNTLLISHDEILWVATAKSGLAFANLNAKGGRTISLPMAEDVSFVHAIPDGTWLVGLDGKGLTMVDGQGKVVKSWDSANSQLTTDAVTGCFECRDGSLLIATYGGGVWRFRNGALAEQLADGDPLLAFCRRMGYDAQGRLWIGSMKDGLNRMEPDGTIANYTYSNSPLHTKCVTDIAFDATTRRLYVATSTGLCYVSPTGDIEIVTDDPDDDVRLSLLHIRTMTTDGRGRLFIGTDSGIRTYDSTFHRIGSPLLSQSEIMALTSSCTADSFVVATTAKGLYVVRPDLVCYGFGNEYGLGKLAFARYALSVTGEGLILAGGFGQFAVVDSRQLCYEASGHAVHVSGIEVKSRSVALTDDRLKLDYHESADVFVTTLDYGRMSTTLFTYRIDDGVWASADGNCVHLSDLDAGTHLLTVRATGAGDVQDLMLRVEVSGPWWRSAWAIAIYLAVACVVLWLMRRAIRLRKSQGNEDIVAPEIEVNGADQEFVERATGIVEAHLQEVEFSVEAFGNEMCLSRSALYKKMMAATGLSPIEFMRTLRMRKGLELVRKGRMSVSEIAAQVGMSPKQFSRFFREQYGVLPSEYINRQQKPNT